MRRRFWGGTTADLVVLGLAGALCGCADDATRQAGSDRRGAAEAAPEGRDERLGTHQPYAVLGMNTGARDPAGRPVRIPCGVCHADMVEPDAAHAERTALDGFHQGVELAHGDHSSCVACHNPPGYVDFRLASGKVVTYGNVVELCGQCHSEQWRDYRHGAHGGMTGYWDRQRGARDRNHCIDCHDPHVPAAAPMHPAPRAKVRFQRSPEGGHE
ncbi:MAG: hypothetical protein JRI23_31040 [Deltaproteobacteria bacterium]|jgi:hypothetical protein|nr:hypothetical protein [Deltaproteobacteria bacterium]MBW2536638.1 hypothetical protein [Deltaproteobacteria bacterium]